MTDQLTRDEHESGIATLVALEKRCQPPMDEDYDEEDHISPLDRLCDKGLITYDLDSDETILTPKGRKTLTRWLLGGGYQRR